MNTKRYRVIGSYFDLLVSCDVLAANRLEAISKGKELLSSGVLGEYSKLTEVPLDEIFANWDISAHDISDLWEDVQASWKEGRQWGPR